MTPKVYRWLPWIGGTVLVAGVVAFMLVFFRNTAETTAPLIQERGPAVLADKPGEKVPLSEDAKAVARKFIRTAVARKNLAASWAITHPELRQGMSRKEWLTGNIPVTPYPVNTLEVATMAIDESYARRAELQVALLPRKGAKIKPQIFFLGMKKVGKGKKAHWTVYYWAPRVYTPRPVLPS